LGLRQLLLVGGVDIAAQRQQRSANDARESSSMIMRFGSMNSGFEIGKRLGEIFDLVAVIDNGVRARLIGMVYSLSGSNGRLR
jgi:hypothetical protein